MTREEYKDFVYYTGWLSPEKKIRRIKYYLTGPALVISLTFIFFQWKEIPIRIQTILPFAIVLILYIIYLRYNITRYYDRYVNSVIRESGEQNVLSQLQLNFNENCISWKSGYDEGKYSWQSFMRKVEVNNCYYLYLNVVHALIIPKRVFASKSEQKEFETLLTKHLPFQTEFSHLYTN